MNRARIIVLLIAVMMMVAVGGCGEDKDEVRGTRPEPHGVKKTQAVPVVPTLAPCAGAIFSTTVTDWWPESLPAGFSIGDASTTTPGALPSGGGPVGATFLLAERGPGDVLAATMTLATVPSGAIDRSQLSGVAVAIDEEVLTSVRGHPGQVAHWINRGDLIGDRQAIWDESGVHWTATSELRVAELAAALEPLVITTNGVRDPSHRFEIVGTEAQTGPPSQSVRRSLITLYRSDDRQHFHPITITIEAPAPGSTGVTSLPRLGPGAAMRELAGARLLVGGTDSAPGFTETRGPEIRTALGDGTQVSVEPGIQLAPVSTDDLVATGAGLRRTTTEEPRPISVFPDVVMGFPRVGIRSGFWWRVWAGEFSRRGGREFSKGCWYF